MKPSLQDEISQNSAPRSIKPSSAGSNTKHPDSRSYQDQQQQQQQQEAMKCPRCDSSNTKFCYYNNYSLTQPRHFCKTCRRYWTKGGALRNVPIGGGCRKNKKLKSSSSSSNSPSSSKLFTGGISPSIDFHQSFPRSSSSFSLDYPPPPPPHHHNYYSFMGGLNNFPLIHHHNNNSNLNLQQLPDHNTNDNSCLASSIESLSSLNQDLHWKLQQQRLATMIFGDDNHEVVVQNKEDDQTHKLFLQPILFQNLEAPKQDTCCFNNNNPSPPPPSKQSAPATTGGDHATTTEWFFGNNSYNHHQAVTTTNNTIGGTATGSGNGSGWNNNNGVQAWEDLHHFTALP